MKTLIAFAALALAGCRTATELDVKVSTDVGCENDLDTSIAIGALGRLDPSQPASESNACSGAAIGTVVLTPNGAADEAVSFEIVTGIGKDPGRCTEGDADCIFARRALAYIPNEALEVEVPMRDRCAGVRCGNDQTCNQGACVDATIDPSKCTGDGCGESVLPKGMVKHPPPPPTTKGKVLDLALGQDHACALLKDGTVKCMGLASDLGIPGRTQDAHVPVDIGLSNIVAIQGSAYANTTGAVDDQGRVYVWGDNLSNQIPNLNFTSSAPVTKVEGLDYPVGKISVGSGPVCGVSTDKKHLLCWGELLDSSHADAVEEIALGGETVEEVYAGNFMVVYRTTSGQLWSFGSSDYRGQGKGAPGSKTPARVPGISGVVQEVAFDHVDVIATTTAGRFVWGENRLLELAIDNGFLPVYAPTPAPSSLEPMSGFAIGVYHACAIASGEVSCWGDNANLAIGPASKGNYVLPVKVDGLPAAARRVWAGSGFSCANFESGDIYCWGANDLGQLGDGETVPGTTGSPPKKLEL